eukprot:5823459-Prymnesium_polylepis.1
MPRNWTMDLTESSAIIVADNLPKPPGYSESHGHESDTQITNKKVDQTQLKLKARCPAAQPKLTLGPPPLPPRAGQRH